MNLRRCLSLGIAAAVLAAFHAVPAVAQTHIPDSATTSFASFNYNSIAGNTNTVNYTLNGGGGATLSAANVPVQFNFLSAAFTAAASDPLFIAVYGNNNQVPTIGTTPYQANLSFTANSSSNATAGGQVFSMSSFSIISDATSSLGAGHNLLSGTISSPMLFGPLGNTTGQFGGSMPPQMITFTSEYATFPNGVRADLSWALNALTVPFTISGNNYLPFSANVSGQNVFKPSVVPEPGSIALLSSLGVCGTVFGFSRLRRRK